MELGYRSGSGRINQENEGGYGSELVGGAVGGYGSGSGNGGKGKKIFYIGYCYVLTLFAFYEGLEMKNSSNILCCLFCDSFAARILRRLIRKSKYEGLSLQQPNSARF